MTHFEIKGGQFWIDKEPTKLLSGAIHYFRVPPSDWQHSLYNLKALGFNTVETYVPWNVHEPHKDEFNFSGILDLEAFIRQADELGLYVILRPSPYICAEWEFGGLPAWLLNENMHIRSSDPNFLAHVEDFYYELFRRVNPYQWTQGGPILMMQIENEYGSYGEDKDYLEAIRQIMRRQGVEVQLFTSDGGWDATLRSGTLLDTEEDILATANFGSRATQNFAALKRLRDEIDRDWPLMCMEFWDGWFNRWGEPIVTRETDELIEAIRENLEIGSLNLYMFHGGTNFGFMNGTSARREIDLPQITSYDYGAPLDEQGNPTDKYYAIQDLIKEMFPNVEQRKPLIKPSMDKKHIPLAGGVRLFDILEDISTCVTSKYPKTMEELEHYYGYLVYRTKAKRDSEEERFRIIDGRDRIHFYVNQKLKAIQYQTEIGADIEVHLDQDDYQIDLLVENMGRVNYGHKLLADTQRKGLRQGVIADLHFMTDWEQYLIDFNKVVTLDFEKITEQTDAPSFYSYTFQLEEVADTHLDLSEFGKGIVLVNGFNIGRFWDRGPTLSLYIPHSLLHTGNNQIIIFETEGRYSQEINLLDEPVFKKIEGEKQ